MRFARCTSLSHILLRFTPQNIAYTETLGEMAKTNMENETQFIKNFNFENKENYLQPTPLKDIKFGFSVIKKMQPTGYGTIFYIYLNNEELENNKDKKSLLIRATYGNLIEEEGKKFIQITSETGKNRKKVIGPIDFTSDNDFFYNIEENQFYHKDKKITPDELLDRIYQIHIKPTKFFKGFIVRLRLFIWRVLIIFMIKLISDIFQCLLFLISGTKFDDIYTRIFSANKIDNISQNNNEYKEPEKWDLFGFKAPLWPITFFCAFHFILYVIFWLENYKPKFVITLLENNFLTVIYTILFLVMLERFLPKILKFFINKTSQLYFNLSSKRIKI